MRLSENSITQISPSQRFRGYRMHGFDKKSVTKFELYLIYVSNTGLLQLYTSEKGSIPYSIIAYIVK